MEERSKEEDSVADGWTTVYILCIRVRGHSPQPMN